MDKQSSLSDTDAAVDIREALSEKQRAWLEHIKRCDNEREPYASYCKRNSLNVRALYAARELLQSRGHLPKPNKRAPQPARFAPVRLAQALSAGSVEVTLANGSRLTWCAPDAASVAELVMLLNGAPK